MKCKKWFPSFPCLFLLLLLVDIVYKIYSVNVISYLWYRVNNIIIHKWYQVQFPSCLMKFWRCYENIPCSFIFIPQYLLRIFQFIIFTTYHNIYYWWFPILIILSLSIYIFETVMTSYLFHICLNILFCAFLISTYYKINTYDHKNS